MHGKNCWDCNTGAKIVRTVGVVGTVAMPAVVLYTTKVFHFGC